MTKMRLSSFHINLEQCQVTSYVKGRSSQYLGSEAEEKLTLRSAIPNESEAYNAVIMTSKDVSGLI